MAKRWLAVRAGKKMTRAVKNELGKVAAPQLVAGVALQQRKSPQWFNLADVAKWVG